MHETITITDLTRMQDKRVCIAGYTAARVCVRPVARGGKLYETWLYQQGRVAIRPFACVEFDLGEAIKEPPHCEDRVVRNVGPYRVVGHCTPDEQHTLLAATDDGAVATIFGAKIHYDAGSGYYVRSGEGLRSLGTVQVAVEQFSYAYHHDRWDYRLSFRDGAGSAYRLGITDLALRYSCDHQRLVAKRDPLTITAELNAALQQHKVCLRISLARHWAKFRDRCNLQITGIYTFPDYLQGRCFADMVPPEEPITFTF